MAQNKIELELIVDDKGSTTVKQFGRTTEKSLDGMGKKAGGFTSAIGGAVTKMGKLAGQTALMIGKMAALGVAAAAALGGVVLTKSLKAFAGFESALVRVGNVSKTSLGVVKAKILAIPPALGNATELVKGYYRPPYVVPDLS